MIVSELPLRGRTDHRAPPVGIASKCAGCHTLTTGNVRRSFPRRVDGPRLLNPRRHPDTPNELSPALTQAGRVELAIDEHRRGAQWLTRKGTRGWKSRLS